MLSKGSLGGANLLKTAFDGDNNEELLNQAELNFLKHPRGVDVDLSGGIKLSSIFKWYAADFGGDQDAVLSYIRERLNSSEDAVSLPQINEISYDYDWSINTPE